MVTPLMLPENWATDRIDVTLVGAGGTGSEMFDALARIHASLVALGHPGGLKVTVWDPDTVSDSNVGRQRFSRADVGMNKAEVLVARFNAFHGTAWRAEPRAWNPRIEVVGNLLITCVDKAKVRLEIGHEVCRQWGDDLLWLDCGNGESTGQVVLGHLFVGNAPRVPNVFDLFRGDLKRAAKTDDKETPSCSAAEALARQDLGINRMVADCAVDLLWSLIRHGSVDWHGAFVKLRPTEIRPLRIDPAAWALLGYAPKEVA